MAEGKYYWLKLKRDFFKRHDIKVIEGLDNGKDYLLFYLKLLCESVDHEGNLRFSEQIPYNEKMLATITDTNIDIVRSAIEIFTQLGMMEIMDDGTYFMNEVAKMIGSAADNDNANRQRRFREKQKALALQNCYGGVTNNNESKSIEIEKELEIEKDIKDIPAPDKKTKHKYGEYNHVLLTDSEVDKLIEDLGETNARECIAFLDEYIEMKGYKAKSHYLAIRKWVIDAVKEHKSRAKIPAQAVSTPVKSNSFNTIGKSDYGMSISDLEKALLSKPIGG